MSYTSSTYLTGTLTDYKKFPDSRIPDQTCLGLDFISRYSSTVICTVTIALLPHSFLPIIINFNVFYIIKAMSIRELTWQIKQVVLEAQNFTSILPSLRIFSLKTYEISDL